MFFTLASDPWTGQVDRAMELLELIAGDIEVVRFLLVSLLAVLGVWSGVLICGHLFNRRVTERHFGNDKGPG